MPYHRFALALIVAVGAAAYVSPLAAQGQRTHYQQAAGEEDVTIRVPMELSNLDASVSQAEVYCVGTFTGDDARVQAKNQTAIDVSKGGYKGEVDVKLALSVAAPGEKWNYTCKLSLYNGNTKEWSFVGSLPWAQPKAGTTPAATNSGTITVQ
ncbi:MAG TPA: hypothetical protein VN607_10095 [Gemmatimonadaceae bacterium]|nr:hypothetical protein [Gemmatimonadaceae bacterium]